MSKLSFEDVCHDFASLRAVDGFNLSVEPGEIVCLLGPSGCGKTTSLRLAAGLERLQTGRIHLDGRVVAEPGRSVPPENRRIGMVFQDYALFPHLTVAENVAFGVQNGDTAKTVSGVLDRVGLGARADRYPHQLSGGEQQRVALARALAPSPDLMLMDEPFANLDVTLRNAVRDETLGLLKQVGTTVLLVTHDPEEAMRMADRIAVMQAGRLVQFAPSADVYLRPVNRFMARFFGQVNEVPAVVRGGMVQSCLGTLPAPAGLGDGAVDMLVRPEGISVGPATGGDNTAEAVIDDVRLIGPYWRLQLAVPDMPDIRARVSAHPPPRGSRVSVTLDPDRVVYFPR